MNRKVILIARDHKLIGIWIIFMVIFMAELLLYTWSRVQCVQFGYELSEAANREDLLLRLRNNLKIEVAHLKSPQRVAKIAREQLGLTQPKPDQLIVIP